jgi:3-hydroxyacyl-CoA dehydrogenase
MDRVTVIGAGFIGRSWAVVFARAGYEVALYDPSEAQRDGAMPAIRRFVEDGRAAGLIAPSDKVEERVSLHAGLEPALEGTIHVQENVFEREDVKRAVFAELDRLVPGNIVLASSSSMIPVSRFVSGLPGAARCLNAHPLNPPHLIPVVEIVPGPETASAAMERVVATMRAVGQMPVVLSREIEGFLVNRLQGALLNEAFRLLEDGSASVEDIDKAVSFGLGLRWSFMGPFETIDLNAPGGLRDYAERYGPGYHKLAEERGGPRAWSSSTVDEAHRQRLALLSNAERARRQGWRDERLLALRVHQIAIERAEIGRQNGTKGE